MPTHRSFTRLSFLNGLRENLTPVYVRAAVAKLPIRSARAIVVRVRGQCLIIGTRSIFYRVEKKSTLMIVAVANNKLCILCIVDE